MEMMRREDMLWSKRTVTKAGEEALALMQHPFFRDFRSHTGFVLALSFLKMAIVGSPANLRSASLQRMLDGRYERELASVVPYGMTVFGTLNEMQRLFDGEQPLTKTDALVCYQATQKVIRHVGEQGVALPKQGAASGWQASLRRYRQQAAQGWPSLDTLTYFQNELVQQRFWEQHEAELLAWVGV
jgi:hypothetical protein